MTDRRGLEYRKYAVARQDGSDRAGGKHEGCHTFVVDLTHDQAARPAIRYYADLVADERPELARDLNALLDRLAREQPLKSDENT